MDKKGLISVSAIVLGFVGTGCFGARDDADGGTGTGRCARRGLRWYDHVRHAALHNGRQRRSAGSGGRSNWLWRRR